MALTLQQYQGWLDSQRFDNRVFVIKLESGSDVIYLSDQLYNLGGGLICDNWVINTPYIEESLDGQSYGSFTFVDMLDNEIGNRDLIGWSWSLYYGDSTWPFADFKKISAGIISSVSRSLNIYTIGLDKRDSRLDKQILTDASQILCVGSCFNFEPILIDGAALKYRVNNGAVSFINVYDKGVLLNSGVTRDLSNGTFTLTNAPAGLITVNSSTASQTLESAVIRLAQMAGYTGVLFTNVSAARRAYVVGQVIVADGTTYGDALQQIANSIGAYILDNPTNNALTIMCMSNTANLPYITDDQIIENSIKQAGILPALSRISYGYTKNYRVMQQSEIAASVIASDWQSANLLMNEQSYSGGVVILPVTQTNEIDIESVLRSANDAQTERDFIASKRNYNRRIYEIQLHDIANLINVGDFLYLSSTAIPFSTGYVQKIKRWDNGLLSTIELLEL